MTNRVAKAADQRKVSLADAVAEHAEYADAPPPLLNSAPLLMRLEHGLRFVNDDLETLQPRLGAAAVVGDSYSGRNSHGTKSIWLSAAAWEGIATIIRQTPKWHRHSVATFLEVLHSSLPHDDGIGGLLAEVIDEVENDPYAEMTEADVKDYDLVW